MTYKLLNSRKDVQLSTAVLFHAVLGPRPIEAFAVRNMDLDLESEVPKVTFRAQYSKVRVECTRYLTKELAGQLKLWLKCKYRKHRVCTKEGRMITVYPEPKPTDLVFAHWHTDESKNPEPKYVYTTTRQKFAELVDTLETGWENDNRPRPSSSQRCVWNRYIWKLLDLEGRPCRTEEEAGIHPFRHKGDLYCKRRHDAKSYYHKRRWGFGGCGVHYAKEPDKWSTSRRFE